MAREFFRKREVVYSDYLLRKWEKEKSAEGKKNKYHLKGDEIEIKEHEKVEKRGEGWRVGGTRRTINKSKKERWSTGGNRNRREQRGNEVEKSEKA